MRLGDAYPKNQPSTGGISGVAGWEEGELGAGALPVCLYIRKDGWAEQGCEPHQEVAVQSAGSSTDGLATRVLWRMLMTGRALYENPQVSAPLPASGQARPGSSLGGPGGEGGRSQASLQTGRRGGGPYSPSPWLTAAARRGPTGSPRAGRGRSSRPRPSSRSGSSRRRPSQGAPAALRGLPGGRGGTGDKLEGRIWGWGWGDGRIKGGG